MGSLIRLVRAGWLFGRVFISYVIHLGLCKVIPPLKKWRPRVHRRNARRLYRGFVRLRGVYIKLGQVLSVFGSFLPPPYEKELEGLQDNVTPRKSRAIRKAVRKSLASAQSGLASISPTALAAASLAQVHRGVTKDGDDVVVKVLYPRIKKVIAVDMRVLGWVLKVYRWFVPVQRLERVHAQLKDMLDREADLAHEAQCLLRMGEAFAGRPGVVIPRPYLEISTPTVLTMSYEPGIKISDHRQLEESGIDSKALATKLIQVFVEQYAEHRFFHADPHPGNLLVRKDEDGEVSIVILDMGSATEMPEHFVSGLKLCLQGILMKSEQVLFQGIEEIGFVGEDREQLSKQIGQYFQALLGIEMTDNSELAASIRNKLKEEGLGPKDFRELMKGVEYPDGWFYVERSLGILLGVVSKISPQVSLFKVAGTHIMSTGVMAKSA